MFGNQPKLKYLLLFFDTLVLLTVLLISALRLDTPNDQALFLSAFYFLPLSLFALLFNDLYKINIVRQSGRQIILLIKSLLIAVAISLVIMALFQFDFFISDGRVYCFKFFLFSVLLLGLFRIVIIKKNIDLLSSKGFFSSNVLIVGGSDTGIKVAESLKKDDILHFTIAGFVDDYKAIGESLNGEYQNAGHLKDLPSIVASTRANMIIIAIDGLPYARLVKVLEQCLETGLVVRVYSDFLKIIAEKINVEYYADLPVVMLQSATGNPIVSALKRTIDLMLSLTGIILLMPLFLIIIAGIKLSSKGPITYKQTRIGKNGKPFHFYKFRSMHVNTENTQHKEYVQNFIKGENECSGLEMKVFKIKDDPRIFPFGHFIRKTSLDEFPQLWNVIKGEMSLVGPRPCLPYEWECYEAWHKNRLNVLPGCTGLWQVLGRSSVTFEEMVILDLYYVNNTNILFWLDLKIVMQTIPVIFFGKGGF